MATDPNDPFQLKGKNLRRVIPQVRRSIDIQRKRMIAHLITFGLCIAVGVLGWQTSGVLLVFAVACLIVSPFCILGFFGDRHLMRWHQARLAECEHRLQTKGPGRRH